MRKIGPAFAFALAILGWSPTIQAAEVLVSAAASLTDALTEIGKAYESNGKNKVRFNFGSSSELARQIDEGAPADIFFSADLEKMDALEKRGRVESGSLRNLLSNQLVLVVPDGSNISVRAPKDLLRPEVKRIALAQPETVPVGIYSKKYLESEGLWSGVAVKIVPVLDVRAALASVESGNVDAGFVYKTDAAISKKVKVAYEVPLDKGPKIIYPVAATKESKNKEAAVDFLKFVSSQAGKNVFRKYGFVVLK
jgi:molybdate transport system substrate-binding protein